MKKTSLGFSLVITSILVNAINVPPTFAASKAKVSKPLMAGRTSVAPSNMILNGIGVPKSTLGIDGDFYIDAKALNIFGPKTKGHWPAAISMRGPQGQTGAAGTSGNNGKSGANVLAAGPQGSAGPNGQRGDIGPKGDVGAVGAKGEMGAPGSAGSSGPKGDVGAVGAKGEMGAPGFAGSSGPKGEMGAPGFAGSSGPKGEMGVTGLSGAPGNTGATGGSGAQGLAGPQGLAGTPGVTGANGPSNSSFGAVNFAAAIQGVSGSSQLSIPFGSFAAGKNYLIRIFIQTFNSAQLVSTYPLAFNVSASGGAPSISFYYTIANGSFWVSGANQDEVSIFADIAIDGSSTASAYQLVATVTCGLNSGSFPIRLLGNYSSILVGQIN
jgi:hypothetical protein